MLKFQTKSEYMELNNNLRLYYQNLNDNISEVNSLEEFKNKLGKYPWGNSEYSVKNLMKLIQFVITPSLFYSPQELNELNSFTKFKNSQLNEEIRYQLLKHLSQESLVFAKSTSPSGQVFQILQALKKMNARSSLHYLLALNSQDHSSYGKNEIKAPKQSTQRIQMIEKINKNIQADLQYRGSDQLLDILENREFYFSQKYISEFFIHYLSKSKSIPMPNKEVFLKRILGDNIYSQKSFNSLSLAEKNRISQIAIALRVSLNKGITSFGVELIGAMLERSAAFSTAFKASITDLGRNSVNEEREFAKKYKAAISKLIEIDTDNSFKVLKLLINPRLIKNQSLANMLNQEAKNSLKQTRSTRAKRVFREIVNGNFAPLCRFVGFGLK